MKKILKVLMLTALTLMMVACSSGQEGEVTTGGAGETSSPEVIGDGEVSVDDLETVKIGVELYDPTDSEFIELKKYFDYLSDHMPVEFMYSEAISSAEEELAFIENAAISGCHAILGYYSVADGNTIVETVSSYGMYYWGSAGDDPEVVEANKNNEYFLGNINYGDGDFEAGYSLGKYAVDKGAKTVVYASGGAEIGVPMFIKRQQGFFAAIDEAEEDIEVITVSGFPGDAFFADQASALTRDIDMVCASFNGVDFWAQPIASAGKSDTVELATIGSLNADFLDAFENGSVSFLASGNIQKFGLGVGTIFNAVNGDANALKVDGAAVADEQGYWLIDSAEAAKELLEIQDNEMVYSAQDVLSLCTTLNAEASRETLEDLLEKGTSESLLER